jgi:hypothetical protein
MISYERVLSYGNIFPLAISCNPDKLISQIAPFTFAQYNTDKQDIPRLGLSITSLDGEINSGDLETLRNSEYRESSFRELTKVYYESSEVRGIVDPFKEWIGRTHILNIKKGGYFPPHRDELSIEQHTFRVIVPLKTFNPPHNYFIYNDQVTHLNEGRAYFMNTNIVHSNMSFSNDTLMLVMNVRCCNESYERLMNSVHDL